MTRITMRSPHDPSTKTTQTGGQKPTAHPGSLAAPNQAMHQQPDKVYSKEFVLPQYRAASEKDSRYASVGLPSDFFFYDFKKLSIRAFTLGDLKKVYRAGTSTKGDLMSLVEAIGSTIDQDVMDLTVGDWWSLMYWLRFNSYKKNPLLVKFQCENPDHIEQVNLGELPFTSLDNAEMITQAATTPILLRKEEVAKAVSDFKSEYGINITAPRVYDLVEGFEYSRDNPSDESGIEFMFRYAICLPKSYGETLLDRVKWIEGNDVPSDAMNDLEAFSVLVDHGVKETVVIPCKGCKASSERALSVDALAFLPNL